jgi:hypothetical protein
MANIPDAVRGFEAAWQQMQKLLADQQTRIEELQRENERLRQDRDQYRGSLHAVLSDFYKDHEDEVEARLAQGELTGVTFEQLVQQLPELFGEKPEHS